MVALFLPASGLQAATLPRFGGAVVRGYIGEVRTLVPLDASSASEREACRQVHAGLYRLGDHLRVKLTLPSGAGNSLQGLASTIGYVFTATQRNAASK